jgi:hypothetical protein
MVMGTAATIESARSSSESFKQDGVVTSKAWSTLQGISLFDGALKIQSLSSESTASLGDGPAANSAVRIEGATFQDKHVAFDNQGLRVIDPSLSPDRVNESSKALNEQLLKNFGARITLVQAPAATSPDLASAETNGLRIALQTTEGGQGAPWCDAKSGLPPVTNCKQVDDVALTLGASSAAVSRSAGSPDSGGLIDVGAGLSGSGGDQPWSGAAPAPAAGAAMSTGDAVVGASEAFGAPGAGGHPASAEVYPGGGVAAPSAAPVATGGSLSARSGAQTGATAQAAPIARRIERERVRPAQVALLALSWLLTAACLAVLIVRSRLARARAAALGL